MSTASCPDWQNLVVLREHLADQPGTGAEDVDREWRRALDHRSQCEPCRRSSTLADPLLLFRDMGPLELDGDAIAQMQQRVAGALRLVDSEHGRDSTLPVGQRSSSRWLRGLAAATVLVALAWGAGWHGMVQTPSPSSRDSESARERGQAEAKLSVMKHLVQMPSVEADAEVTLLVDGESFELVQLGSLGH